jgi:hypothetical protein
MRTTRGPASISAKIAELSVKSLILRVFSALELLRSSLPLYYSMSDRPETASLVIGWWYFSAILSCHRSPALKVHVKIFSFYF